MEANPSEEELALRFWEERHLCMLAVTRPQGPAHLTPVGATYDPTTGIARIITSGSSVKARLIEEADPGALVALSQMDGRRWTTLEGTARVIREAADVRDAEQRYAARYRTPRPNPLRVVIEIRAHRVMGTLRVPLPAL